MYPKPLSEKSLNKMYANSNIDEKKSEFLHKFFLAAANLYGFVELYELWDLYKSMASDQHMLKGLLRRDFVEFSSIARRETLPYRVYEQGEIFLNEGASVLDRLIVNNQLVHEGYGKFGSLFMVERLRNKENHTYFIPKDFLYYANPKPTKAEEDMRNFLGNLRVNCKQSRWDDDVEEYPDAPVGKKLSELDGTGIGIYKYLKIAYDADGKLIFTEAEFRRHMKKFDEWRTMTLSDAIMQSYLSKMKQEDDSHAELFNNLYSRLTYECVELSDRQHRKFLELYQNLHNSLNKWYMCGWSPNELMAANGRTGGPKKGDIISIGPNMRKAIADGTLDAKELKKTLEEMGFFVDLTGKITEE